MPFSLYIDPIGVDVPECGLFLVVRVQPSLIRQAACFEASVKSGRESFCR